MNGRDFRGLSVALGGAVALAAALGIGRFVYTPILPFMEDGLGLTKPQAGLIASANYLGYLLGALLASLARLPGGQRIWLMAALAVSAITTGAMALPSSVEVFVALRFAGGTASAFVFVFASSLVLAHLMAARRPELSGIQFAGVGFGIAGSALFVAGLAALGESWRAQWFTAGAVSLAALFVASWLIPSDGRASEPAAARPAAGIERRLVALIIAYGLFGFGYVITATFISTMARDSGDPTIEPIVWLTVGLTAIPSLALWAWVAQRLGNGASFAIACLVEAGGVALSVAAASPTAILTAAVVLGGTFIGITAVGLRHAQHLSAGDPRRTIALMTVAFGVSQMIGPTFAGFAHDLGGSFAAPTLAAAAALVFAAALVARPGGGRDRGAPSPRSNRRTSPSPRG